MSETVISVENLYKEYKLGVISHGTLYRDLQSWWARVRGKEDPNSLISAHHTLDTEEESFLALNDISFEVKAGEILGIIGKNGAGKSTLLKILSRITAPTKGQVKIKGRVGSLLEVGTGFHPELTGRENIYLNGVILGMKKWEIDKKIDEIIDFAGIERHIDTPVKRYSSGMYVRLAFSVAAHLDPEILIVDEVLAVGDAVFQKKCLGKMKDISEGQGRTVLFVSHNMGAIRQLCTRSLLLLSGSVIMNEDANTVIDSYLQNNNANENLASIKFELNYKKKLQLVAARLINSQGKISNNFDCDNSMVIELMLNLNILESGNYGYLQISKSDGTIVMVSDSNDVKRNSFDLLKKGNNKVTLTIPPRTLGPGSYTMYLNFTDNMGNTLDSLDTHLFFHIDDLLTGRGNKRGGFFSTLVAWEIGNN